MIHGAMLYFSEKGRSTLMPKTTTRHDKTVQTICLKKTSKPTLKHTLTQTVTQTVIHKVTFKTYIQNITSKQTSIHTLHINQYIH